MTRAPDYSLLFHVTLAAFVSGATVGFLRPDFPAELTQATARASGWLSNLFDEPGSAPQPAPVEIPITNPPAPSTSPVTPAPVPSPRPQRRSPIVPAQTLPSIDLETMMG